MTNNGVLHPEVKRHYMRIRPPECGEAYATRAAAPRRSGSTNRPPGTRTEFEAREIIDAGFLELVRYGVRRADDPLIVDSLEGGGRGAEARTAAGAGLAALQLGRLRPTARRRPLRGLGHRAACGRC